MSKRAIKQKLKLGLGLIFIHYVSLYIEEFTFICEIIDFHSMLPQKCIIYEKKKNLKGNK